MASYRVDRYPPAAARAKLLRLGFPERYLRGDFATTKLSEAERIEVAGHVLDLYTKHKYLLVPAEIGSALGITVGAVSVYIGLARSVTEAQQPTEDKGGAHDAAQFATVRPSVSSDSGASSASHAAQCDPAQETLMNNTAINVKTTGTSELDFPANGKTSRIDDLLAEVHAQIPVDKWHQFDVDPTNLNEGGVPTIAGLQRQFHRVLCAVKMHLSANSDSAAITSAIYAELVNIGFSFAPDTAAKRELIGASAECIRELLCEAVPITEMSQVYTSSTVSLGKRREQGADTDEKEQSKKARAADDSPSSSPESSQTTVLATANLMGLSQQKLHAAGLTLTSLGFPACYADGVSRTSHRFLKAIFKVSLLTSIESIVEAFRDASVATVQKWVNEGSPYNSASSASLPSNEPKLAGGKRHEEGDSDGGASSKKSCMVKESPAGSPPVLEPQHATASGVVLTQEMSKNSQLYHPLANAVIPTPVALPPEVAVAAEASQPPQHSAAGLKLIALGFPSFYYTEDAPRSGRRFLTAIYKVSLVTTLEGIAEAFKGASIATVKEWVTEGSRYCLPSEAAQPSLSSVPVAAPPLLVSKESALSLTASDAVATSAPALAAATATAPRLPPRLGLKLATASASALSHVLKKVDTAPTLPVEEKKPRETKREKETKDQERKEKKEKAKRAKKQKLDEKLSVGGSSDDEVVLRKSDVDLLPTASIGIAKVPKVTVEAVKEKKKTGRPRKVVKEAPDPADKTTKKVAVKPAEKTTSKPAKPSKATVTQPSIESMRGMTKDFDALLKSAHTGNVRDQALVGARYAMGTGVQQSMEHALSWTEKAAEQNEPMAQMNMALHYHFGFGVPHDRERSRQWQERAARSYEARGSSRIGVEIAMQAKKNVSRAVLFVS